MEELIQQLENALEHTLRLEKLARLGEMLAGAGVPAKKLRRLAALLYHRDWYVRREAAFLIDRYGIPLTAEERLQFQFALQQFPLLVMQASDNPLARQTLLQGCLDPAPKIRAAVAAEIPPGFCRTPEEEARWHYAAGDFVTLLELASQSDYEQAVKDVLKQGMNDPENPPWYRRQCAFSLAQLKALDDASAALKEILKEAEREPEGAAPAGEACPPTGDPLQNLLHRLNRQGIIYRGQRVFPEIAQNARTGRITYRRPPLQTLSKTERLRELRPNPGYRFLRFDFIAIEPTLLLHFLVERFYLNLEELPDGDFYRAIYPENRELAKKWVNILINGGGLGAIPRQNNFFLKFREAVAELRTELLQEVMQNGQVQILGGKTLPLNPAESNLGGKAMNRLVQGSAAEFFHRAVLQAEEWAVLQRRPVRTAFLLYDEVWFEAPEEEAERLAEPLAEVLQQPNRHFSLLVPVKVRREEAS
ncbi:MAG: hypothetical protein Kow0037_30720 [Calditrichia bacterium]